MDVEHSPGTYPAMIPEPIEVIGRKVHLVVLPSEGGDWRTETIDLERFEEHPRRKSGDLTVTDLASFIAYVARHREPGTIVAANMRGGMVATINHHEGEDGAAGWRDHRVTLARPFTAAWSAWQKVTAGSPIGQRAFADLIEERLGDIAQPAGADLLDVVEKFHASRALSFKSEINRRNGEATIEAVERIDDGDTTRPGGNFKMPTELTLSIRMFRDDPEPMVIVVRVSWALGDKAVTFTLKMADSAIDAIDALYDAAAARVASEAAVPVFRTDA